ncbi:MAG: hypothetical protein Q7V15_04510 [Phenylobacterium sp.]|uniref:hypothetical protein n=1 Tax=Phenylobacterium sp. TaxID=1871053 RepID=UPI00271B60F4|nr:hypothetical protein [Phenylobacterium sp.]MDO8900598.1 hypothetical protein [Phenylobacterium sp.]
MRVAQQAAGDGTTLVGPLRTPRNTASEIKGSIHEDATASKLGFRGGTVAGSIHMDQFVPLLVDLYGQAWFEGGNLSLLFKQPTVDGEAVSAQATPGAERARLQMYDQAMALICQGSAADHADAGSELSRHLLTQETAPRSAIRILADVHVGDEAHGLALRISPEALTQRLETITEPLECYQDGVLPPSMVVHLAHGARSAVVGSAGAAVGLFGALEIQFLEGPLRAGVDYVGRTRVHALTESPRTENVWYDVLIADPRTGRDQARVTFCLRFMKDSSPLWARA